MDSSLRATSGSSVMRTAPSVSLLLLLLYKTWVYQFIQFCKLISGHIYSGKFMNAWLFLYDALSHLRLDSFYKTNGLKKFTKGEFMHFRWFGKYTGITFFFITFYLLNPKIIVKIVLVSKKLFSYILNRKKQRLILSFCWSIQISLWFYINHLFIKMNYLKNNNFYLHYEINKIS